MNLFALYLLPLYLLLCIYILYRLVLWLSACHPIFKRKGLRLVIAAAYFIPVTALGVGFLLPEGGMKRVFTQIGNYWIGILAYSVLILLIAEGSGLFLRHWKKINQQKLRSRKVFVLSGLICIGAVAAVSVWGIINAKIIRLTPYEITVHKDGGNFDSINVVLAADLHMGYNIGCSQMEQMVEKINAQDPDLVVIAGDLFDNNYDAIEDEDRLRDILKGIQSRYGVYACYGNHDIQEPILAGFTFPSDQEKASDPRMDAFLESAGIILLRDEYVLINDSFYLYGRADEERPGRGIKQRQSAWQFMETMESEKPIIVLDHEPKALDALAEAGVDVDLCGHTHDGQLFPANLLMKLIWENPYGYLQKGQMHSIVTSGAGLFGPNMRVGTKAEICTVKINFIP